MAINKVTYGDQTLVDLTEDTVTPETLAKGITAHDKSGAVITGTMEATGGDSSQLNALLNASITELISSVDVIAAYSCRNRSSLTRVDLANTRSIGAYAFTSCTSLSAFILRRTSSVCTLTSSTAFSSSAIATKTGYIYVPAALIDSYRTASQWSTYSSQFRAIEDYPDICGS